MKHFRIIGIDPGSRITGYGVIEKQGSQLFFISCGVVRPPEKLSFPERLEKIHSGICEVIAQHSPTHMAIEDVFVSINPKSALKLGHARGVLILAGRQHGCDIHEYTPTSVKQAVVGYGQATKSQVQHVVRALLKLSASPSKDAADALAIGICHANYCHSLR